MSETHVSSQPNGPVVPRTRKKSEIATSTVEGSIIDFKVGEEHVIVDVAKLPDATKLQEAVVGARTSLRLSFQKMDDPVKVLNVLRQRAERMLAGLPAVRMRRVVKTPTDLTQALANINKLSTDVIENKWYAAFFALPESGCQMRTVKGKTRIYGKNEALNALRNHPDVKAEIERIVKARGAAPPTKKFDLNKVST